MRYGLEGYHNNLCTRIVITYNNKLTHHSQNRMSALFLTEPYPLCFSSTENVAHYKTMPPPLMPLKMEAERTREGRHIPVRCRARCPTFFLALVLWIRKYLFQIRMFRFRIRSHSLCSPELATVMTAFSALVNKIHDDLNDSDRWL